MNNRFMFRGKRVNGGKWTTGCLSFIFVDGKTKNGFIFTDTARIYCQEDCRGYDVYTKTIGQWIINEDDQDIFESDIIEEWKHGKLMRRFTADNVRTFTREYDLVEHGSIFKVVGNIYDNPELLK